MGSECSGCQNTNENASEVQATQQIDQSQQSGMMYQFPNQPQEENGKRLQNSSHSKEKDEDNVYQNDQEPHYSSRSSQKQSQTKKLSINNNQMLLESEHFEKKSENLSQSENLSKQKSLTQSGRIVKGPYVFDNGAVYEGEWIGDMRDGYGKQTWPDGAKYEGLHSFTRKPYYQGNGQIIRQMEKANSGMLMAIFMKLLLKENERTIKQMDMVFTITTMVQNMKAVGKMTFKMVSEQKCGVMGLVMRVNTQWGKRKERGLINEVMDQSIREIERTIKSLDLDFIHGLMEEDTKVIDQTTICMEREYILGKMVENMRENISTIRSTDMEFTFGLIFTLERKYDGQWYLFFIFVMVCLKGLRENNMEKYGIWEYGKRIKWLDSPNENDDKEQENLIA